MDDDTLMFDLMALAMTQTVGDGLRLKGAILATGDPFVSIW